jgi:hypothetical protein
MGNVGTVLARRCLSISYGSIGTMESHKQFGTFVQLLIM